MASWDRVFTIHAPSDYSLLHRKVRPVANRDMLNPTGGAAVPISQGEFVTFDSNYEFIRATNPTLPAWAWFEDRGDPSVVGSGRGAAIFLGNFEADTVIYNSGQAWALGDRVMVGTVNNALSGSQNRSGLVIYDGGTPSNIVLGRVTRLPASNGTMLRFVTCAY